MKKWKQNAEKRGGYLAYRSQFSTRARSLAPGRYSRSDSFGK
jgi:hypothetical protein